MSDKIATRALKPCDGIDGQEWLNQRHQPGNWLAISPDEELPSTIEGWDRTIIHMFQTTFTPEIMRRQKLGLIDDYFFVQSAQLLQPEGKLREVRFNDDVRGVMHLDLDDAAPGRVLTLGDVERMVSFDLLEEELDCGHFTIFWTGRTWRVSFDFRNGRARSAELVRSALEFIELARFGASKNYVGATIDNLFSGCELLCKVQAILAHSPVAHHKRHGSTATFINSWGKLGNCDPAFVELFNRLANDRGSARYEAAKARLPSPDEIAMAQRMAEALADAVKQRA